MMRDFKFMRGNNRKTNDVEEIENVPINPNESNSTKVDQEISGKSKFVRTPTKPKGKNSDNAALPLRTPERQLSAANVGKNKFGFSSLNEGCGERRSEMANYLSQSSRYGSSLNLTPRVNGGVVKGGATSSIHSECTSTQSTPTKSVSKPPNPGFAPFSSSRHHGSARGGNYGALSRRFSVSSCPPCIVNTVEVPHFDLKEDPSFWMYHNVQVILRVRPLNSFEINTNGYNRCVKQDSAQCITWVGQPETRFTFDHVACETVDQELLFRMAGRPMVENCLSGYNSCMFAYGQTGSGKTFTMLGEIEDLEFKPSPHRGMTPRIFEFLFARIRAEEESRRDEKLKYSCKCSFLEIYNEQITDLLDPSSSNLLLREDVKKGVYVENLSEFEVHTVGDVVRLLVQGSANRKVAATNMNRESSRSHSVFTCNIESKWERDSTTNLRFARLNLVDLAGSERQKSSGAEGERLKEAANINKSLSTLGHVIMLLVDIAQGKPRHVPYRDSRLTFLLQDSLGGNSKTMIIANISPSIGCAAETLNTLKFAQRAKLIQNNAVVNEDSTGDVAILQHQICLLQEELSALRRQSVSRTLAFDHPSTATCQKSIDTEGKPQSDDLQADKLGEPDSEGSLRVSQKQLKAVESMLAGALRREQMADTSIRQLEAEIEQLNRLVRQREEDARCSKMMLKFREDKIQRMESLLGDLKPVDSYLAEENAALVEEVQMLQAKVDKNPEVTRFALENIRLLGQLRKFQDFYEEGERDILMNEVSELRAQLIRLLEYSNQQSSHQHSAPDEHSNHEENQSLCSELMNTMNELDGCRSKLKSCLDSNAKLNREIEELQAQIRNKEPEICNHQDVHQMKKVVHPCAGAQAIDAAQEEKYKINQANLESHAEEIVNMELELDILRIILKEERLSHKKTEEMAASLTRDVQVANDRVILISKQFEDARRDMEEAKAVIEALESQQLLSINEIEDLKNVRSHYQKVLRRKEHEISVLKEQTRGQEYAYSCLKRSGCEDSALQTQLKRMQASLDKAKRLNTSFQSDHVSQKSNEEEIDEIRRQAEAETAEVIVSLQEELCMLQQQVHESELREKEMENKQKELQETIDMMSQDNEALHHNLLEKNTDWENLSCEIEEILVEGCEALGSASDQLDSISSAFSNRKGWISQQFGKLMRLISEKESIIAELNQCLEDANCRTNDLEHMLLSLRGATMVVTESHQQECFEKEQEILVLRSELSRKASDIAELDDRMKLGRDQLSRTSDCATAAFLVVSRLSEINSCQLDALKVLDTQVRELQARDEEKDGFLQDQAKALEEARVQIDSLGKELEISESNCTRLTCQLDEQQRHLSVMQRKLEENDEKAIENTKEILNDLKMGVSGLRLSMNQYVEVGYPERHSPGNLGVEQYGGQTNYEINKAALCFAGGFEDGVSSNARNTNFRGQKDLPMSLYDNSDSFKSCCRNGVNNSTIILLKKELESAMESLKEVQAEMVHLSVEKEEIRISEKKGREGIEIVKTAMLNLEVAFSDFEKQCETKISDLSHKLQKAEEYAEEARSSWWKTRESLEFELVNVEATAAQKEVEASCLLARFEEVQDTIQEADIMINGLMIANENLKLEVEDLKRRNTILKGERNDLSKEVKDLQSSNELKDTQCKNLEEQFESSISEMMGHVEELEKLVLFAQDTSEETFMYLAKDLKCVKSQLQDTVKLVHSLLEEIWSEIVIKDCALSVLHLCHMGLLLETVTGLNAENGLLHHGICESNVMICNLREHNMKSKEELEMCRVLKGKLLADIKNSFDRISSKEGATTDLNMKLISFKEKLEALQHQEELMFERSNIMGSELALLMKELDQSNSTVMVSLAEQEELLKSREEVIESQADDFMVQLCTNDFVLLILASELQQLALHCTDLERENVTRSSVLDSLLKDIVTLTINVDLKEQLLCDMETDVLGLKSEIKEAKDREDRTRAQLETLKSEYQTSAECLSLKEKEGKSLHNELDELKSQNGTLLNDLQTKEAQHKSTLGYIDELKSHNCMLQENILTLESKIASLQNNLEMKTVEIDDIMCSRLSTDEELGNKIRELESYVIKASETEKEILVLRDQLYSLKQRDVKALQMSSSKVANCVSSVETAERQSNRMLKHLDENIITVLDHMSEDACLNLDLLSKFSKELEFLDSTAKDLVSKNESLQEELFRKDEVLNGLLFDLHLLQESAANNKDQKDVIDELTASLESAEHELDIRSHEYDEVATYNDTLEAKLKEREDVISELEADLDKTNQSAKILSDENIVLRSRVENIMEEKSCVDRELSETRCVVDRLENELLEMGNTLGQMNELVESLKSNLDEVSNERDNLQNELLISKEQIETAYALAEENEAIAAEAQEIAESRRIYAEEKEEEVKLLESSVLELDSTISVLENKVELLNGEAERQRIQREELELELQTLKNQMHNIESTDADIKRHLDEKAVILQEALKRIKVLEKELTNKDAEIAQCKTHISELTVHAEAQACEYKNKFKELEAMVGQVKAEETSSHDKISSSNKLEKNGSKGRGSASPFKVKGSGSPFKARGSGSPFKCIGLGLAHQFKSEKDEDVSAERHRIEELEALAASRQKEIFMLNARLAAAESMTHDVIRDLLGVKLDMSNYVKLLDKQQVQKMMEKARLDGVEPQTEEVKHLKQQLNEFIEERRGWLEEIDRRQAELVAAQDALKNHRQEQQMLIAENDVLKKRVTELEGEVKKLSGQQNLHHRIHHHAKIKEENNALKTQKEDLTFRLQRAESYLSRVKEELSHYRARRGRDPCVNFDLEQRLTNKLKEVEEEKVHLAHTLFGLCTSILKAAGITKPASEINVSEAEEALEKLSSRVVSLEREVDDLNLKHKISNERIRLGELMAPDSSPFSTRSEDNHQMSRRAAQTPFFSALDR